MKTGMSLKPRFHLGFGPLWGSVNPEVTRGDTLDQSFFLMNFCWAIYDELDDAVREQKRVARRRRPWKPVNS